MEKLESELNLKGGRMLQRGRGGGEVCQVGRTHYGRIEKGILSGKMQQAGQIETL